MRCQATILTPADRGAIATISLVGEDAVQAVERFFRPHGPRSLASVPVGRVLVGHWRSGGDAVEEVVVARIAPDQVEVHCHGGLVASQKLLSALRQIEVGTASEAKWLRSQSADPIVQAAWQALGQARTERAAAILLDQWRGALSHALQDLRRALRPKPDDPENAGEAVRSHLQRLLRRGEYGVHLTRPWRVVLAGAPNVGKSSLANALLGYQRSIVMDQPGTTRDVLAAATAFDGWAVEIVDTAGYRDSEDPLEREGASRAWQELERADLALIVFDASRPGSRATQIDPFRDAARQAVLLANQVDRGIRFDGIPPEAVPTSAVTGAGLDAVVREVVRRLVPEPPAAGAAVPFTPEQCSGLSEAASALQSGDRSAVDAALARLLGQPPERDLAGRS